MTSLKGSPAITVQVFAKRVPLSADQESAIGSIAGKADKTYVDTGLAGEATARTTAIDEAAATLDAAKVNRAGDAMAGALDMAGHPLPGLSQKITATRRPTRYAIPITDANGKAANMRRDGAIVAKAVAPPVSPSRRPWALIDWTRDAFGRIAVAAHRDGYQIARGLRISGKAFAQRRPSRFVTGIGGRRIWKTLALLGFDVSGRANLRLNDDGLSRLGDDLRVTTWRGSDPVSFVRPGVSSLRALAQDPDGTIYDAIQTRDGFRLPYFVADAAIEPVFGYGQSNEGYGSGNAGSNTLSYTPYRRHVVTLADSLGGTFTDIQGSNAGPDSQWGRLDFAPAQHPPGYGVSPIVCTAQAMVALDRSNGRRSPLRNVMTSWRGSTAADLFLPNAGYYLYENLIAAAGQLRKVAATYGLSIRPGKIFEKQGENGPFSGYESVAGSVIDAVRSGVQTALGTASAPLFFFTQINQNNNGSATTVEIQQRQLAIDRLGMGVFCTGPMYQCRLFSQIGGSVTFNIHADNPSRMMISEVEALVASLVDTGASFQPAGLSVTAARAGAVITLTYANLPGDGQLRVDADWIGANATVPNLGFKASKVSDGSALTITSAVVSGTNQVVVTLSADPGSAVTIDYARDTANQVTLWAGGRGLLYVTSGVAAPFSHAMDATLPTDIRHYALRMSLATAT